jgi:chromosome segregation ATPase
MSTNVVANGLEQLQDMYKKVAEGLITIRKEYPQSQSKVYTMLDHLDKLYALAKNDTQKSQILEKKLQEKTAENTQLKNELTSVKGEIHTARKTLEAAKSSVDQRIEEDKQHIQQLTQERNTLVTKVAHLEEQLNAKKQAKDDSKNELVALADTNHPNLNRISTSEPNSPP